MNWPRNQEPIYIYICIYIYIYIYYIRMYCIIFIYIYIHGVVYRKKKLLHIWIGFCTNEVHCFKGFWFVLDTQTAIWRQKAAESSPDHLESFNPCQKHDSFSMGSSSPIGEKWKLLETAKYIKSLYTEIKDPPTKPWSLVVFYGSSHEWAPAMTEWDFFSTCGRSISFSHVPYQTGCFVDVHSHIIFSMVSWSYPLVN